MEFWWCCLKPYEEDLEHEPCEQEASLILLYKGILYRSTGYLYGWRIQLTPA